MSQSKIDLTEKELAILRHLAKQGPAWYYQLSKGKGKVASNKTVLKLLAKLQQDKLIEVVEAKPGPQPGLQGRNRKFYGLTFKGFLFALNFKLITPKEAAGVRQNRGIWLPHLPNSPYPELGLPMEDYAPDLLRLMSMNYPELVQAQKQWNEIGEALWAKVGRLPEEPLILRKVEHEFSETIYSHLLKTINILNYDEEHVGHELKLALSRCESYLWQEAWFRNKPHYIEIFSDCLKHDKWMHTFIQGFFSVCAKAPSIPEKKREFFAQASKQNYQGMIDAASNYLKSQKIQRLLKKGRRMN